MHLDHRGAYDRVELASLGPGTVVQAECHLGVPGAAVRVDHDRVREHVRRAPRLRHLLEPLHGLAGRAAGARAADDGREGGVVRLHAVPQHRVPERLRFAPAPPLAQHLEHDVVEDDLAADIRVLQEPAQREHGGGRVAGGRVEHDGGVLLGGGLGEGGLERGGDGRLGGLARGERCSRGGEAGPAAGSGARAGEFGGTRAVGVDPEEPRSAGNLGILARVGGRRRVLGRRVLDGDMCGGRRGGGGVVLGLEGERDWAVRP
uniref:Uncharacterized protein n=1 Tax=Triticum urartu TaxID=4572 RepID=A0A8R7RBP0_TRIUA